MSVAFETRRLPAHGLELVADVAGDPDSRTVVFTHGGGQSRRAWRGAAALVAETGRRVISLDLRGHGDSDWARDGDYRLEAFAADVVAVLNELPGRTTLVGASRGGQAAFLAAAQRPERVRALMLADVTPWIEPEGVADMARFLGRSAEGFARAEDAVEALAILTGKRARAESLRRAMETRPDGRLYFRWDPRTAEGRFVNPPSEQVLMEAAAAGQTSPVLLVRGAESTMVSERAVERFRQVLPGLDVVDLQGIGHMVTGDRNDPFAAALLAFLDRT